MNVQMPVPYIRINVHGTIEHLSDQAKQLVSEDVISILDCFDEESHKKLANYVAPFEGDKSFEANIKSVKHPFLLCDVYISWEKDFANIIFIPKDHQIKGLKEKVYDLKQRLASTDFELFEKKEALERTMKRLDELSGPFIPISEKIAFVPLFGDISEGKMKTITSNALKAAYEGEFEEILFDFSATGEIDQDGLCKLNQLFQMIQFMNGNPVKIMGVKPKHARQLHTLQVDWPVYYETSLKAVLQKMEVTH